VAPVINAILFIIWCGVLFFVKIEQSVTFTLQFISNHMNYSIEKKSEYSIIKPEIELMDQDSCSALREKVLHEAASSSTYVIVNIITVKDCNEDGLRELIKLGLELQDKGGMLIITHAENSFTRLFNKADITFIPTDIEAIDFVFMDHLEKQLLDNDNA
jgi:anti-anti-sigma regulatory factor